MGGGGTWGNGFMTKEKNNKNQEKRTKKELQKIKGLEES